LPRSGSTDDEWLPAPDLAPTTHAFRAPPFSDARIAKTMTPADVDYLPETPAHDLEIDQINEEAFGPGRFARAAYKIREGGPHERNLSFVGVYEGMVIASVRLTRIAAGSGRALLLGPLAVRPDFMNLGIGRRLMAIATEAATRAGHSLIVLVGDEPYYGPLGYSKIPHGQLQMPRPVDPERLLALELVAGTLPGFVGEVTHADKARTPAVARSLEHT
jgi:predicted N-acetyltransferase YhbS